MTKRVKLLKAVRKHLQSELVQYCGVLSIQQIEKRKAAIEAINKRLPHFTTPAPRISSQRKLFY